MFFSRRIDVSRRYKTPGTPGRPHSAPEKMITWAILAAVFLCAKGEVQPAVVVAPVVSNVTEQETVTLGYGNQSSVTSEQRGFRTDWSKPFFCPKERYSLSITCGQKDVNYMSQLERDAMRQNDLTDPTRCGRFRFDNIVSIFKVIKFFFNRSFHLG